MIEEINFDCLDSVDSAEERPVPILKQRSHSSDESALVHVGADVLFRNEKARETDPATRRIGENWRNRLHRSRTVRFAIQSFMDLNQRQEQVADAQDQCCWDKLPVLPFDPAQVSEVTTQIEEFGNAAQWQPLPLLNSE